MATSVSKWHYRIEPSQRPDDVDTVMRYRVEPVQFEVTNTLLGHWRRIDDLAYTILGVEANDWIDATEDEARAVPDITWFDDDSTETIPFGTREMPEDDYA